MSASEAQSGNAESYGQFTLPPGERMGVRSQTIAVPVQVFPVINVGAHTQYEATDGLGQKFVVRDSRTHTKAVPAVTEAQARKQTPVYSGVLRYFPDALREVARLSQVGNDQHNPGQPLHWAKHKSTDELDALTRHLLDAGTRDTDGQRHSTKVAWRALANLQRELDGEAADTHEQREGDSHGC